MKSQVLHTVWCYISGEAAGEIWHRSPSKSPVGDQGPTLRGERVRGLLSYPAGLFRIKKMFPGQPGATCGKLQSGDIVLEWMARAWKARRTRRRSTWCGWGRTTSRCWWSETRHRSRSRFSREQAPTVTSTKSGSVSTTQPRTWFFKARLDWSSREILHPNFWSRNLHETKNNLERSSVL